MNRYEAEVKLRTIFGIPHFYDEQWTCIERIFKGEHLLMIQCTGFGKSLCYQFPATQLPGVTIVFSPLIALMRDQVDSLCRIGVEARCINWEQGVEVNSQVIEEVKSGLVKILYIHPQRIENTAGWTFRVIKSL